MEPKGTKRNQKRAKVKLNVWISKNVHSRYKKFCKENGLIIGKRVEGLLEADVEKRLIKIPEVRL